MKLQPLFLLSLVFTLSACGGSSSSDSSSDDSSGSGTGTPTTGESMAGGSTGGGGGSSDGGSEGGSASSNTTRHLGIVSIDEVTEDNEVDAGAAFFSYDAGVDSDLLTAAFEPELDECTVEIEDISFDPEDYEAPEIDSIGVEMASAGEVLTLTSGAGSYLELVRQSAFGFLFYAPQPEFVDGPMPTQLTLDIPGDQFPSIANIDMPTVQSLSVISPSIFTPITQDTEFTWAAGNDPDAFIGISVTSPNSSTTMTFVDCVARDDGSFSFPEQTRSELGPDFAAFGFDIGRASLSVKQQGDALLILTATSSN